jgi:acetoin utilization deacetylase AcuC-like enzyme
MKTVYSDDHFLHDVKFEILSSGLTPCFEKPARVQEVIRHIRESNASEVISPLEHGLSPILKVHSEDYVEFLSQAWQLWEQRYGSEHPAAPYCFPNRSASSRVPEHIQGKLGFYTFDLSASITSGTWQAIRTSVDVALTGLDLILAGERAAFSLCRPPGHHASADLMGGYCYFNNAAIAAQAFIDSGNKRVAILDVDYHHGNGTQRIFYNRSDVFFLSIHGHPDQEYPHFWGYADEEGVSEGAGFNHNVPLSLENTDWEVYANALNQCLEKIQTYRPDCLVVSLGLDTFENDPMAEFKLKSEDYLDMGKHIATSNLPTLFVFEGGYAIDALGVNTLNVLTGFEDSL